MTGALTPDDRLSAPAALRNREVILAELQRIAPAAGRALEIASGTGEHVVRFAAGMPGLTWTPSDPAPARRASIAAWSGDVSLPNLLPPIDLDAAQPGWAAWHGAFDLIFLANLLHLISSADNDAVLDEMAQATAPGGVVAIYGPFLRDGETTSEGDAAFHASLRAEDPQTGYKDLGAVIKRLIAAGLAHSETVAMPANNLLLVFRRRSVA